MPPISGYPERTVLDIVRAVSAEVGVDLPDSLFGAQTRTLQEFQRLYRKTSEIILKAHYWQELMRFSYIENPANEPPDLLETAPLPANYFRMSDGDNFRSDVDNLELIPLDWEQWAEMKVGIADTITKAWTLRRPVPLPPRHP